MCMTYVGAMMRNLIKLGLIAITFLLITGCAQSSKISRADSHAWTTLTCSGFSTWNECRQQAKSICPNGFYTSDQLENYTIQRREVSVACKS